MERPRLSVRNSPTGIFLSSSEKTSRMYCLPCLTLMIIFFFVGSEVRGEVWILKMRGQQEGLGPRSSITIRGSQDLITPSCFTCSGLGEWRKRQVPTQILRVPPLLLLVRDKATHPCPIFTFPVFPQLGALTCRNQRPCFAR